VTCTLRGPSATRVHAEGFTFCKTRVTGLATGPIVREAASRGHSLCV